MIARSKETLSRKAWIILGLLVLCLPMTSVHAANERDIANRMNRLENEIQTLSRAIYKGEDPPPPSSFGGGGNVDAAELNVRIDQLEIQIRELTGRLEEISHQNTQLRTQIENTPAGGNVPAPSYPSHAQTPPPPINDGGYPDQPAPAAGGNYEWSTNTGGEPTPNSVIAPSDAGSAAYENAFAMLKNGQYDAAEQGFLSFLGQYPNHALTANAKYWLGESYYARGLYDKSARTFAEAYQQFPQSPKAPDNLLKLGLSLAGQGKKEDACIALGQIEKDFPTTAGPVLSRAKTEMANFGC